MTILKMEVVTVMKQKKKTKKYFLLKEGEILQ